MEEVGEWYYMALTTDAIVLSKQTSGSLDKVCMQVDLGVKVYDLWTSLWA